MKNVISKKKTMLNVIIYFVTFTSSGWICVFYEHREKKLKNLKQKLAEYQF